MPSSTTTTQSVDRLVRVRFRNAASQFEILDNVSRWWKGKNDPEYQEAWRKRFGIGPDDEARFAAYKTIRKRYYEDRTDPGEDPATAPFGLFAPRKIPDRVANAFYAAEGLEEAFATLAKFVDASDLATLRDFFGAYAAPLDALRSESEGLEGIAAALDARLARPESQAAIRRLALGHGASDVAPMIALFVWWPPVEHVTANQRDHFLIMKYNPEGHRQLARADADVVVHELIHYLSSRRPDEHKRAGTRVLMEGCGVPDGVPFPHVIEEPLAVAHQRLFSLWSGGVAPRFDTPWYGGDPWVDPLSKALYEPLRQAYDRRAGLDLAFMTQAAELCRHVRGARESAAQTP